MTVSPDKPLTVKEARLVELLPTAVSATQAAKDAGYAPNSAAESACEALRKSNVINALNSRKRVLSAHIAAAQTHFYENVENIAEAMANRALGEGRDSQRAGERILEETGVLHREPLVVVEEPSRELLGQLAQLMAIAKGRAITVEPASIEDQASERVSKALGDGGSSS